LSFKEKVLELKIKLLPGNDDIPLPEYATDGSAGLDLRAAVSETLRIKPKERALVPTGIIIGLTQGFEAQVRPRSGLAVKNGIMLVNSPGTIDSDYRGEIKVIMFNSGDEPFEIKRGDRIAQLIINKYERVVLKKVDEIEDTSRGEGGFGHTGSS
jgi:dUTP pyrophosphatase